MSKNNNIANLDKSFLDSILGKAVKDSVSKTFSHLLTEREKQKQNKISSKIDDLNLRAEKEDSEELQDEQEETEVEVSAEEKTDTSSPKVKAQKLPAQLEPEDVAKMLNIIRAGKSLKDPDVKKRFDVWWDMLSPPEKVALKGFLDGIAQIIAGDVEAEEASKPSKGPYNVAMNSEPQEKPRKFLKKTVKDDEAGAGAGEDSPIIVGEVNSISEIKKRMVI
tara:strand:+ start:1579 stop:2241 length:663 start_codon:yes stop_codon:yes gene_type:complete